MYRIHNITNIDLSLFHKIDINLYPVFLSIYEQKSISKAAQILSVSQSATSHALNRLRQLLNDDLFVRAGHQMLPTPYAEQIHPQIHQALNMLQSIAIEQHTFDPSLIKQLKIAVHDEIEPMVLPKIVAHFQKLNLDIQIISAKLDRKNMLTDLMTQQIDFIIDLEQTVSEKLFFVPLVKDRFMVCSQHTNMNQNTYLSSPHIGVSSRRTGTLVEDIFLQKQKLSRQILLRCQHYSTALQILQQYPKAILTIPENILRHLQIPQNLTIFEAPVELPVLSIGIYGLNELDMNSRYNFLKFEIEKIFA